MTNSFASRETWFSTQKSPDAASLKMVPPWKWKSCDSCPYLVGTRLGVLQMNWSVETKSPTLYWSLVKAPSWSLISHAHETFVVHVLALDKTQMKRRNNTISSQSKTWLDNGRKKIHIAIWLHIMLLTHHLLDAILENCPSSNAIWEVPSEVQIGFILSCANTQTTETWLVFGTSEPQGWTYLKILKISILKEIDSIEMSVA